MRRDLSEPTAALVSFAVMWRPDVSPWDSQDKALACIAEEFGAMATAGPSFDFTHTSYYEREMGQGLKKRFVALERLHPRGDLVALKHATVRLEGRFLDAHGARTLNVDPMLVTMENVVIATSKNFPHRTYLGSGVFADLALIRRVAGFEPLPWTYRDYAERISFFEFQHGRLKAILSKNQ